MAPPRKPTPQGRCKQCGEAFDLRYFYRDRSMGWKKRLFCSDLCRQLHRGNGGVWLGVLSLGH